MPSFFQTERQRHAQEQALSRQMAQEKLRLRKQCLDELHRRNEIAERTSTINGEQLKVYRKLVVLSKQSLRAVKEQNRMMKFLLLKMQRLEAVADQFISVNGKTNAAAPSIE